MGKKRFLNWVIQGLFCSLIFLCFGFNRLDFNQLQIGTEGAQIVRRYGEPYSVRERPRGVYEYEYIEKISMNRELVYENHYFLQIIDGKLTAKWFKEETRQPFDQMYRTDPNYPHYP